jgi:hypothetical protein
MPSIILSKISKNSPATFVKPIKNLSSNKSWYKDSVAARTRF